MLEQKLARGHISLSDGIKHTWLIIEYRRCCHVRRGQCVGAYGTISQHIHSAIHCIWDEDNAEFDNFRQQNWNYTENPLFREFSTVENGSMLVLSVFWRWQRAILCEHGLKTQCVCVGVSAALLMGVRRPCLAPSTERLPGAIRCYIVFCTWGLLDTSHACKNKSTRTRTQPPSLTGRNAVLTDGDLLMPSLFHLRTKHVHKPSLHSDAYQVHYFSHT